MRTISILFRCGHFEKLTRPEIKKQQVVTGSEYKINGTVRADAGDQYCLACSNRNITKRNWR